MSIPRAQTHPMFLLYTDTMSPYPIFAFWILCDITDDVTGILCGHPRFSSIPSDQVEIETQKGTIVMVISSQIDWYATWPPRPIHDLMGCDQTLNSGQRWLWSFPNKKYIILRELMGGSSMPPAISRYMAQMSMRGRDTYSFSILFMQGKAVINDKILTISFSM